MSNEKKKSAFWSPRSGILLAVGFLGLAGVPYLIQGGKVFAETGKVSAKEVVEKTKEANEKKKREHGDKLREMKTAAVMADGTVYAGGKGGLAVRRNGEWAVVTEFPTDEAKAVAAGPDGTLWVAGKRGLHVLRDGEWKIAKEGDMHSVSISADGTVAAVGKKNLYLRDPAGVWSESAAEMPEGMKSPEGEKEHGEKDKH